jgi:hypothetical protein
MSQRTDKSVSEILAEAGGIERFISPAYQDQCAREHRQRTAAIAEMPDPRAQLRAAISGIECKCLLIIDVMPELMMLLDVLHFLNQLDERKEAA